MTSPAAAPVWNTDAARFCLHLADRLMRRGFRQPVAAAISLSLRGRWGADIDQHAEVLGVPVEFVGQIEAGPVALDDLPADLLDLADATLDLDWPRLLARG